MSGKYVIEAPKVPVNKPNRPHKVYDPDVMVDAVYEMRLAGFTKKEIARRFNVWPATVDLWREQYDDFAAAFDAGSEAADGKVARALFERATGYDMTTQVVRRGADGEPVVVTIKQHIPADVTAASRWLASRQGRLWNPKEIVQHINGDEEDSGLTLDPKELDNATLEKLLEAQQRHLSTERNNDDAVDAEIIPPPWEKTTNDTEAD